MDTDKLIQAAVAAIVGALTKAAAEPALAAGGKAWAWLKGRLAGADAATAASVEAAPDKPSAPDKVTALLKDVLHGDPAAVEELRRLLDASGGLPAITQTANFTGNRNIVNQVAGSGNIITNR